MINREQLGVLGGYEIYINGEFKEFVKNRLMDTVLSQMIGIYRGQSTNLEILYLALGTDNTAVTDTDTALGNEIFRTPVSTSSNVTTGEILTEFVVLDNEAVASIEEIGIFGGSGASGAADSGTLISRILWSKTKTSSEEITFRRTDKVVRG
jgi:hypothetical protein